MKLTAKQWMERLDLRPHPEGGYYRVTYEADGYIPHAALPSGYGGARRYATGIYFLIDSPSNFSAFHRIRSDEMWHFYAGDTLTVHLIDRGGAYSEIRLGAEHGFQTVVPGGCWFASSVEKGFALAGCTVAPGFDFADFELANRPELIRLYPRYDETIARLTR